MWNAISPGFELVSPCPIPATITITPRALLKFKMASCTLDSLRKWFSSIGDWCNTVFFTFVSSPAILTSSLSITKCRIFKKIFTTNATKILCFNFWKLSEIFNKKNWWVDNKIYKCFIVWKGTNKEKCLSSMIDFPDWDTLTLFRWLYIYYLNLIYCVNKS